jgi:hypothetical protein
VHTPVHTSDLLMLAMALLRSLAEIRAGRLAGFARYCSARPSRSSRNCSAGIGCFPCASTTAIRPS